MPLHPNPDCRIVVTGIGVIHALGTTADAFWNALIAGESGIKRIERFDPSAFTSQVGSEMPDFDAAQWMDAKEAKRSDRYTHFAMAASKQAIADAGLDVTTLNGERFGCIIGSGIGGLDTTLEQTKRLVAGGPRKVSPFLIPSMIANIASGMVAIEVGAKGPNYGTVSACASGSHALGDAFHMMRRGEADVMLAGGSEAAINELGYAGFCSMKAMSTRFNDNPSAASRPFDAKRDGFVMGEGAGILVLETHEHATARGAKIYAELVGYGASCDAYHITSPAPDGSGLANCLNMALEGAGVTPESVDYINAHGTSTPYNDKFETLAVKKALGDHANKVAISSTKSMTGHLLGAAGGIEAAVCALAITRGEIPPTINYEEPDPDCDLDYVPNRMRTLDVRVAVSNNLGFGGHNASLIFRKI